MPTTVGNTVAWTADVSAAGFGSTMRLGRGCVNAAETFAYYPDRQTGATQNVFKLNLSTQVWTKLYADAFFATPIQGLALSADEATLYAAGAVAGVPHLYASNTDGTGSATDAASWSATAFAPAFTRIVRDPVTGYVMGCDASGRTVPYLVPGTWGTPANYFLPDAQFVAGIHPARYDPDKLLIAHTVNCSSKYVLELSRRAGRCKALAGNGSNSSITAGDAYANPCGDIVDMQSDTDGRLYLGGADNSNVYSLIGGTTALLRTGGYSRDGGLLYLPTANALLVCDSTFTVRKLT